MSLLKGNRYICKQMIDIIDKLRKQTKTKKCVLCAAAGISVGMYYRYLKGASMTYEVCDKMLGEMGYKLQIVLKED